MDLNIYSLITTSILALAAILAYIVQRARYLREIEPDLELKWPDSIRVVRMSPDLKEGFAFYIDIKIENLSKNHAQDLKCEVDFKIFPHREKPQVISGKIRPPLLLLSPEILAERVTSIPIYIGTNIATELWDPLDSWNSKIDSRKAGFTAEININYFGKRELLLWFLVPWKFGRVKYTRSIFGAWWVEFDARSKPPHKTRYWEHPSLPRETIQSVTSKPW